MLPPTIRYPDPAVRVLHPSFEHFCLPLAAVERIAGGLRWAEGPVWFGDGRYLLCSDIPNNRIVRWSEHTGLMDSFREPSGHANGNTRDRQGRLVTAEHGGRRVTRTEHDGTITVLADCFKGKRLNSPNDLVVKSDGSIWFTDPPFGIAGYYQGERAPQELPACVYRIDGVTGAVTIVTDAVDGPNGLAFSPDERVLYVIESRSRPRTVRAFAVSADGTALGENRVLIDAGPGTPDGFRVDVAGNLWCGWGMGDPGLDGVRVFNPQGEPIGHIDLPERCANLCFGGRWRNRLFMASCTSIRYYVAAATGEIGLVLGSRCCHKDAGLSSRDWFSWRSTSCFLPARARSAPPRSCACPTAGSRTCSCVCAGPKRTANLSVRTAVARSATRAGGLRASCDGAARRAVVISRSPRAPCLPGTSCRCGPTCSPSLASATRSRALCQEDARASCCTRDEGGPFGAVL